MSETSVLAKVTGVFRQAWRDMLSIYYANTPIWKLLKSGALVLLGVFCWAGGNLFKSYLPGAIWLNYVIAYGALVIFYGPFTHLVIVPLAIRWRRRASGRLNKMAKKMSKINITVFVVLVLVVGTYPPGFMLLDFDVSSGGTDVNPELECVERAEVVECELTEAEGVAQVVVTSGGDELLVLEEPPYEFEVRKEDMVETVGQRRYVIELRDEDGGMLRRFSRSVPAD
ncbi:MAG: hypothetical protein U5J64_06255 [Halobacteriales archaeon]|nr:hypothetical protein [Halobacteriales archaeon]